MNRRGLIVGAGAAGLLTTGCDKLASTPPIRNFVNGAEGLTMKAQRLVVSRDALAREFRRGDISHDFRANGSIDPREPEYLTHVAAGFAGWLLTIDGLVRRPLQLDLKTLMTAPARTQITRHDCVEGWSSIGEWTGARLGPLLQQAGLRPEARFLVFHCADILGGAPYYESIDLVDAFHPQTILAYRMNGATLPVKHGAPIRLRVERHLGYKHAKYVRRIEAVADYSSLHGGGGGYWEDRGYEWYAGI